ncbi:HAMP domain-containing sensor histidine kinase [Paenibacillus sp. LHD-117]|uniref:sensor histidine kinase n=1 Tax=Paenibacillus sp. LHD-117 TaxID=3071412 RepID=UPI0027E08891|nr:HAMP domain-containing sensor histidine kinase [Paenibacillus sp. LHD-117]MDQ6419942.1 HAMP domain-containing sensor histidine kinase [Paenibacillus sp. LHD-117]
MSIRLRLTLWYSGLLAATLLVFGVSLYVFMNWNTYSDVKTQLKATSDSLRPGVYGKVLNGRLTLDLDYQSRSQLGSVFEKDMYLQLINYQEGLITPSGNLRDLGNISIPYPDATSNPKEGFVSTYVTIGKAKYKMMTYQVPLPYEGKLIGLLQVGAFTINEDKQMSGLRTILIFLSVAVVLIAFTVGLLIARQALRPIERVIVATRQIEKGSDLSMRIPEGGPKDEIGTLVDTLNKMLSRLELAYNELDDAYKVQRRFVSDASHELRTPLTTIRGNIDLLEKMWSRAKDQDGEAAAAGLRLTADHFDMSSEAMSDISAEAKRMSTLVNDLLALARADAGYVMEKEKLDLRQLTEEVVRRAALLPRNADWKVGDLSKLREAPVYGNHDYLQQLLFIFIENAFKYTPSGYVELSSMRREGHVGWMIRDTGIGMNPDEIPHIFDRFYRADESRGVTVGTGLGLSIAKWILDEHRGSVEVTTLENEGTTFVIWLPIDFNLRADSSIIVETDRDDD